MDKRSKIWYDWGMKKILAMIVMLAMGVMTLMPAPALAVGDVPNERGASEKCVKDGGFLGFRPWYAGLVDGNCNVVSPSPDNTGMTMVRFIWTIILNITSSLISASGLVMLGIMIAGGFMYITSNGDAGRVTKAKGAITGAVIGTIIVLFAGVITNTIIAVISGAPK